MSKTLNMTFNKSFFSTDDEAAGRDNKPEVLKKKYHEQKLNAISRRSYDEKSELHRSCDLIQKKGFQDHRVSR